MSIYIFKRGEDKIPCIVCHSNESNRQHPMLDVKVNSASDNVEMSVTIAVHRACLRRRIDGAPES